jgi:uncharacterized lipoprotein YddW (UPF0748 family)
MPEGITGLDQYAEIFADPVKWMDEGWVDYLAPQLYWPTTQTRQAYGALIAWWSALTQDGRSIFAGNYLSKVGTESAWSVDELRMQIALSRAHREERSLGNIHFQIAPLLDNREDLARIFAEELYPTPALTPIVAAAPDGTPAPPSVADGIVTHPELESLRAIVVYEVSGEAVVERIVDPSTTLTFGAGPYAITAVDRFGRESRARPVP